MKRVLFVLAAVLLFSGSVWADSIKLQLATGLDVQSDRGVLGYTLSQEINLVSLGHGANYLVQDVGLKISDQIGDQGFANGLLSADLHVGLNGPLPIVIGATESVGDDHPVYYGKIRFVW